MKAKSFFYVCAGILLLTVAATVGPLIVRADYNADEVLVVGFSKVDAGLVKAIRSDGTVWQRERGNTAGWVPATDGADPVVLTPPVPIAVAQIAHFQYPYLVSKSGELWHYHPYDGWTSQGVLPGGAIQVEGTSITDVKSQYR